MLMYHSTTTLIAAGNVADWDPVVVTVTPSQRDGDVLHQLHRGDDVPPGQSRLLRDQQPLRLVMSEGSCPRTPGSSAASTLAADPHRPSPIIRA
jgi:hypothetical protein